MKFNAYFVRFSHPQASFSGVVQLDGENVKANFKRIDNDLFVVYFKNQVELRFLQKVAFKNTRSMLGVLLPVLSQYNQRKLKKISEILSLIEMQTFGQIICALLAVEKFLAVADLLHFFAVERWAAIAVLTELEIAQQVKTISFNDLFVTSWSHYSQNLASLEDVLRQAYENREKMLKFSQLEKVIKVPQTAIFFRYLLRKCSQLFPLKIVASAIIFSQLPLAADEKERMAGIEKVLKTNKLPVFTIENVQKNMSFSLSQINDALWYMLNEDKLLRLNERYFIFSDEYNKIINRLKKFKRNQGDIIAIDDLRAMTSYSRKYLIILFEFLDEQNITQRIGNKRKILLGA
ncbi:MAG: SelB C-terminal domain-containing protein [Candidatus Aminicenantes bacterium]|nr:SelB C-terminal domain-containing protein [Candidatus Aminicenantes bacterium]